MVEQRGWKKPNSPEEPRTPANRSNAITDHLPPPPPPLPPATSAAPPQSYKYNDINDDDERLQDTEESDRNPNTITSDHSSPDSSPLRISLPVRHPPKVNDTMLAVTVAGSNRALIKPLDPAQHVITFNPTYDQLWAPIYGPAHPYAKDGIAQGIAHFSGKLVSKDSKSRRLRSWN